MMCYTLYLRRFLVLVGYLLVSSIILLTSSFADDMCGNDKDGYKAKGLLDLERFKDLEPFFYTSYGGEFDERLNGLWNNFGRVAKLKNRSNSVCKCDFLINNNPTGCPIQDEYECCGPCGSWYICNPHSGDLLITPIGNEPTYFEINMLKYSWNGIIHPDHPDDPRYKLIELQKDKFINFRQEEDEEYNGYIWSWGTSKTWPSGDHLHYDGNAKYILAVYRYLMWTDDFNILNACVNNPPDVNNPDKKTCASRTVLQKIIWAMNYQLEQLKGKSGLLETPQYKPVDYWDNHLAGYHSANLNVYFYASLRAMAVIKKKLQERGGLPDESSSDKAAKSFLNTNYDLLAEQVKQRFNGVFWDSVKGRYISSVEECSCPNGERKWDFGMTFLQFEAMYYGLVDNEFVDVINKTKTKASAIYDWLDGKIIIKSDTDARGVVGEDIYKWRFASVSNTVPIESITYAPTDTGYWWNDLWSIDAQRKILNEGIRVASHNKYCGYNKDLNWICPYPPNASYGKHLENGGAIFYTSFYDIMARFKYLGANDAHKRMTAITAEYDKDKLIRDPETWKFGIIGEFPESGLVPTVFLYGYMGIDAKEDGLNIRPKFPKNMTWGKVNEIIYHDNTLGIEVNVDPDDQNGKVKAVNIEVKSVTKPIIDLVIETRYPNEVFSITNNPSNNKVRFIRTNAQGILKVKNLELPPISKIIIEKVEKPYPSFINILLSDREEMQLYQDVSLSFDKDDNILLGIKVNVDPYNQNSQVKAITIEEIPSQNIELVVETRYPYEVFSITNNINNNVRRFETDSQGILRIGRLELPSTSTTKIEKLDLCDDKSCPQEPQATYSKETKELIIPFMDISPRPNGGEIPLLQEVSLIYDEDDYYVGGGVFRYKNSYVSEKPQKSICRNATYYPNAGPPRAELPCVDYYPGEVSYCPYSETKPEVYSASLLQSRYGDPYSLSLSSVVLKGDVQPTCTCCK